MFDSRAEALINRCAARLRGSLSFAVLLFSIVAVTIPRASAGPFVPGDDCADPIAVDIGNYTNSTVGATTDGAASCQESANDVWFTFTSQIDGNIIISTCGSAFDTVLSIHSACPEGGSDIHCDDDTCGNQAQLVVPAVSGETFLIRLAGFEGETGDYVLDIAAPTPTPIQGDDCFNSIAVELGSISGSTVGATTDGSADCTDNSNDVWFHYTPDFNGLINITTCNSSFDTVLSIHSDCPPVGSVLGCNDDVCDIYAGLMHQATNGTTVLIRLSGFVGEVGDYTLNIEQIETPTGTPTVSPTPTATPFDGRTVGDFDNSGCTDLTDFLFMLDFWGEVVNGEVMLLPDFLRLVDNWMGGVTCP